jgi:RNA polymerase sigma factor (sigma-70 family)
MSYLSRDERLVLPSKWAACGYARRIFRGWPSDLILLAVAALPNIRGATPDEVALVCSMGVHGSGGAEEIYRLYSQRVYRFIYWRIGEQAEDAEDLALDTFINAINLSKSYDGRVSVFAWLCGIARLRLIDRHRSQGRAKRGARTQVSIEDLDEAWAPAKDGADDIVNRISASQIMDSALLTLSADESESLMLLLVDGLSIREIATHMKRSEDAIDSLTRRGKKKLRVALLQLMKEEGDR